MFLNKLKTLNSNIENFYSRELIDTLERLYDIFLEEKVFLVGGIIRDIFLERYTKDIDIVSEDYLKIGNKILQNFDVEKYRINEKFMTFNIFLKSGINIDIASFRLEKYPFSGSLPIVAKTNIFQDVKRRDFSINSIYYNINTEEIFDFFSGIEDIKNKKIKILHEKSFEDDPTRMIRGIKFLVRYDFSFDKTTEIYLKEGIKNKYLGNISSTRLKNELLLLFSEKKIMNCIEVLKKYSILDFIGIDLDTEKIKKYLDFYENNKFSKELWEKFNINTREFYIFMVIFFSLNMEISEKMFDFFEISKKKRKKIKEFFLLYP